MTTMLKGKDKLSVVELQALLRLNQTLDRPGHVRALPRRSPEALQQERDIIEWNSAVDARKAAKRARKGGRP